jgi:hypothetical protein
MARYAYDADRHALVAAWPSGVGDRAITVASIDATVAEGLAGRLADRLTHLSAALWHTYTHPASGAQDDLSPNTEGWCRLHDREAFAKVPAALRAPHLPENGGLPQSYIPVEEAAHRVGRALHEIGSPALTDASFRSHDRERARPYHPPCANPTYNCKCGYSAAISSR